MFNILLCTTFRANEGRSTHVCRPRSLLTFPPAIFSFQVMHVNQTFPKDLETEFPDPHGPEPRRFRI